MNLPIDFSTASLAKAADLMNEICRSLWPNPRFVSATTASNLAFLISGWQYDKHIECNFSVNGPDPKRTLCLAFTLEVSCPENQFRVEASVSVNDGELYKELIVLDVNPPSALPEALANAVGAIHLEATEGSWTMNEIDRIRTGK